MTTMTTKQRDVLANAIQTVIGTIVVVGPAYSMETRSRSIHDEYTGFVGTVVRIFSDGDLGLARGRVEIDGNDDWDVAVHPSRCSEVV